MSGANYPPQQLIPLLEAYGMSGATLEFFGRGTFAEVYRVQGLSEPYLLRIRAPEASPEEVQFARLWGTAVSSEVPVPQAIPPQDGVPQIDHRCAEVITYIDHEPGGDADAGPDAWERVGYWMGCIHRKADEVAAVAPVGLDYGNHPHERLFRRCLEQARIGCLDDGHRQLMQRVDALHETVGLALEPHLPHLPVGVVHGDLHFSNVLYAEGMPVGIIDLDFLQRGLLLHDLAYASHWLVEWEKRGGVWDGITARYLTAYETGRNHPLADPERICLPLLRILSHLYFFVSKVAHTWTRLALAHDDLLEAEAVAAELSSQD